MKLRRTPKPDRVTADEVTPGEVFEVIEADHEHLGEVFLAGGNDGHELRCYQLRDGAPVDLDVETLCMLVQGAFVEGGDQ